MIRHFHSLCRNILDDDTRLLLRLHHSDRRLLLRHTVLWLLRIAQLRGILTGRVCLRLLHRNGVLLLRRLLVDDYRGRLRLLHHHAGDAIHGCNLRLLHHDGVLTRLPA